MIEVHACLRVKCDGECGEYLCCGEAGEYAVFDTKEQIELALFKNNFYGWKRIKGKIYCDECQEVKDEK